MVEDDPVDGNSSSISDVWSKLVGDATSPGFSLRTTYPSNPDGVEVMLERWDAGTEEPPHSHPGDDMTIVVEGRMSTQRYRREGDVLVLDGEAVIVVPETVLFGATVTPSVTEPDPKFVTVKVFAAGSAPPLVA